MADSEVAWGRVAGNSTQGAAKENRKSVSFWRALSARAMVVAPTMQPRAVGPAAMDHAIGARVAPTLGRHSFAEDMSMVLAAFARLRLRDREMMLRVAEATPAILGQFSATDITSLCSHCSRMLLLSTCSGSCFAPTYVAGKGCYHIGSVLEALAVSIEARGISSPHFPDWTWSTGLSSTSLQGRLRGAPFRSDVCHLQLFESPVLKYWEWAEA